MLSMLAMFLTFTLLSYCALFFIHLKLELLTQFPAPNDEKWFVYKEINVFKIVLLD